MNYAAKQAHLSRPMVVKFQETPSIFDLLTAESKFVLPDAQSLDGGHINVNGINVNIDPETFDRLRSPRLMYLWRGG